MTVTAERQTCTADWLRAQIAACAPPDLAPIYEHLCKDLGWKVDTQRLVRMQKANEEQLRELDAKIKDAEDNLTETDVRDACLAKAEYLTSIGDRAGAAEGYKTTEEKTPGVGNKIDMVFSRMRWASRWSR